MQLWQKYHNQCGKHLFRKLLNALVYTFENNRPTDTHKHIFIWTKIYLHTHIQYHGTQEWCTMHFLRQTIFQLRFVFFFCLKNFRFLVSVWYVAALAMTYARRILPWCMSGSGHKLILSQTKNDREE